MNKGFVVLAQNTTDTDYIRCAEVLAKNIKKIMPDQNISLITSEKVKSKYFDKIVRLPYGDLASESKWKLINDWQVYEASPYEYTIKLEADIYIPRSISHWWDILQNHDLIVSTTIRNFKQEISDIKAYRRLIYDNNLPDTYNAITYFKKSETARKFFMIVKDVFENWNEYKTLLKCKIDEQVTTDWAYAIASHIIGVEKSTLPCFTDMSMVHMKQHINGLPVEDWTEIFVYEILPDTLRINTIPQLYPFHYHKKSFANKIDEAL